MNYSGVIESDIANGLGVRVSLFVSGCTHRCKNCFNKKAWDFDYGDLFDEKKEEELIRLLEPSYIRGLTLLGGEPLEPQNQQGLYGFIKRFRERFKDSKDIWCYTGFVLEKDLKEGGRAHTDKTNFLLSNIDVLVDGPFVEELKDLTLKFRGSSNQRIIDLKKSALENKVVLYLK